VLAERVARTKEFMAGFQGFMDSMPVMPPHNKEQEIPGAMAGLERD
jgi:hypothetical protein